MAGPLNLVFNILADSSQAESSMKSLQDAFRNPLETLKSQLAETASKTTSATAAFDAFTASTTGLAVGVGALAGAAVALGAAFAKSTADVIALGSSLNDLSITTGLSVENLSGLRVAAATGGSSLDQLSSAFVRFQRAAVDGGQEAKRALAFFGVTAAEVTRDSSAAFDKLLKNFNELPPSAERTAAAINLFGRDAARLMPTLEGLSGGLEGARKASDALGVTMSTDLARAADEAGDAIDELKLVAEGFSNAAGKTLLPVLQDVLAVLKALSPLFPVIGLQIQALTRMLIPLLPVIEAYARTAAALKRTVDALRVTKLPQPGDMSKQLDAEMKAESALIDIKGQRALADEEAAKQHQIALSYQKQRTKSTKELTEAEKEAKKAAEELARQLKTSAEAAAKYAEATRDLRLLNLESQAKDFTAALKVQTAWIDERNKTLERTLEILRQVRQLPLTPLGEGAIAPGAGIPGVETVEPIKPGALTDLAQFRKDVQGLGSDFAQTAGIIRDDFTGAIDIAATFQKEAIATWLRFGDLMAQGIGQVVEQYVLLGTTGPAALKKVLAATLATIAAENAAKAVQALAYGFLFLALQQYQNAANAFIAAGIFASIATATGLAGRAIAGGQGAGAGSEFGGTEAQAPGDVYIGGTGASIGRRREDALLESLEANTAVMSRLSGMPPGQVAVLMADENPVVFTNGAAEGAARDSGAGRRLMANAGVGN